MQTVFRVAGAVIVGCGVVVVTGDAVGWWMTFPFAGFISVTLGLVVWHLTPRTVAGGQTSVAPSSMPAPPAPVRRRER